MKKKTKNAWSLLLSAALAVIALGAVTGYASKDETAISAAAETTVKMGIDVSKYQGTIDWSKVKASGVDFAILQVGYDISMDTKFTEYVAGATAAGVPIGAYYYSYADSVNDAIAEANTCVGWLKKYPATFSYPIIYDIEEEKIKPFAADACAAFCNVLRENGYYPMVYANTNWLNNIITPLSTVSNVEFWQAHYYTSYAGQTLAQLATKAPNRPAINSYNSNVTMWQCTDGGVVSGISGGVDTNICYVDYETLIKSEGYNGYTPTAANTRYAVCTGTNVNIRSGATTASNVLGTAVLDDEFTLKKIYNSAWLEIEYNGATAYISASYAKIKTVDDNELPSVPVTPPLEGGETGAQYAVCTGTGVNIRQEPNTNCTVLGGANIGDEFKLLRVYDESWFEIEYNGGVAYISALYATIRTEAPTDPDHSGDSANDGTGDGASDSNSASESGSQTTGNGDKKTNMGCLSALSTAAALPTIGLFGLLCIAKKKRD